MATQTQNQNQTNQTPNLMKEIINMLNSYKIQFWTSSNEREVWIKGKMLALHRDSFEILIKQGKYHIIYAEYPLYNMLIVRKGPNGSGNAVTLPKNSTAFYNYPYLIVVLLLR
jgi:hypothetical protein